MVGYAEITFAMSSLKTARDMIGTMTALRDAAMVADLRIGLQSTILDAQSALFEVQKTQAADAQRIADLEREIASMEKWDREIERYALQATDPGTYVYSLKQSMSAGEPPHWLCANCVTDRKKSVLQRTYGETGGITEWTCGRCKQTVAQSQYFSYDYAHG